MSVAAVCGRRDLTFVAAFVVLVLSAVGCAARDTGNRTVTGGAAGDLQSPRSRADAAAAKQVARLLSQPLTLERAVQVALLNNPSLQAALESLGSVRSELVNALATAQLELEAPIRFQQGQNTPSHRAQGTKSTLPRLLLGALSKAGGGSELDAEKLAVASAALDLAFSTRTAFYRYQAAVHITALRRTALKAVAGAYAAAKELHRAGDVSDLDLMTEEALYEDCRLKVSQALDAVVQARERMNLLMGVWGPAALWKSDEWMPDPSAHLPEREKLEQQALAASVDLAIVMGRLRAAARAKNLANLEKAAARSRRRASGAVGVRPGAPNARGVPAPIALAHAEAEVERQRRVHAAIASEIRAQLGLSTYRVVATAERAEAYRIVVIPLGTRIVRETRLAYEVTNIGLPQLLRASCDQIEDMRAYMETVRDHWIARAEIDHLLAGRLLPTDARALDLEPGR